MTTIPVRLFTRITTPALDPWLRVVFGLSLIVQGLIRLIDGRLFAVTHLEFGSNTTYGALMLACGVMLCVTRDRRTTWYGALAAAITGMFFWWLAAVVWHTAATSGGQAIVYGYALLIEARVWSGGGRWLWNRAT